MMTERAESNPVVAGPVPPRIEAVFRLLDVELWVDSDDPSFVREFASVFGRPEPDPGPAAEPSRACLRATLDTATGAGEGIGTLRVSGDDLADPAAYLLSFSSPTVPIRPAADGTTGRLGETALAIGDDPAPALWFGDGVCRFRLAGRWRRILSHFLFLRVLRLRDDALFFHAASLGIAGQGVLLVGPKGSGKSTLALSLAARGHAFLGDETACYLPASRQLLPFWRPVGIKPGPRGSAIRDAVARLRPPTDEDGLLRVDVEPLLQIRRPSAVPLGAVVFLQGFASEPRLEVIQPGRDELAQLQPLAASLTNHPATHRVFEMIRLLGGVRVYRLVAGPPDETADLVARVLGDQGE